MRKNKDTLGDTSKNEGRFYYSPFKFVSKLKGMKQSNKFKVILSQIFTKFATKTNLKINEKY